MSSCCCFINPQTSLILICLCCPVLLLVVVEVVVGELGAFSVVMGEIDIGEILEGGGEGELPDAESSLTLLCATFLNLGFWFLVSGVTISTSFGRTPRLSCSPATFGKKVVNSKLSQSQTKNSQHTPLSFISTDSSEKKSSSEAADTLNSNFLATSLVFASKSACLLDLLGLIALITKSSTS